MPIVLNRHTQLCSSTQLFPPNVVAALPLHFLRTIETYYSKLQPGSWVPAVCVFQLFLSSRLVCPQVLRGDSASELSTTVVRVTIYGLAISSACLVVTIAVLFVFR